MAEKTFLDHAAKYAYQQLDKVGGDLTKVEPPLQTVAIIYTVQGMFDNGGFRYIFENDFPFSPPYSLFSDAYRRIGAIEAADLLDKAVAIFPFETPQLFQDKRNEFMDSLDESHEMFELGNEVCGDARIWSALEKYAKQHASSFRVT